MPSQLKKLFKRIRKATKKDLKHKTVFELFASAAEELGEVADELTIEQKTHGHSHKKVNEGVRGESVDLAICAICLFFAGKKNKKVKKNKIKNFIQYANMKIDKWEKSQKKSKKRR